MHRQSLGSPVSKLHFHGGSLPKHNDDDDSCILASSLPPPLLDYDDEHLKTAKPSRRFSSSASASASPATPEKLIHLIPIVVLFCFLILYLVSHNPSQSSTRISLHPLLRFVFQFSHSPDFPLPSFQQIRCNLMFSRTQVKCIAVLCF
ncbi:hypothetical protein LINPERHAP2_LOCUS30770 [Linum perenne]